MNSNIKNLLPLGILVFLPGMAKAQSARPTAHATLLVKQNAVVAHASPAESAPANVTLAQGTLVTSMMRDGDYIQVRLANGQTGWVYKGYLADPTATAGAKPIAANPAQSGLAAQSGPGATPNQPSGVVTAPQQTSTSAAPTHTDAAQRPAAAASQTPAAQKPAVAATQPAGDPFAGAKPDSSPAPQESPAASVGDAWKLLLYLVPVLGIAMLAVRLLKLYYEKTGRTPAESPAPKRSLREGLIGGMNLVNARKTGGSNIRVIESVPVGGIGLHLIEARGRTLLLGASGGSVSMLADLTEREEEAVDFGGVLNRAERQLDGLEERASSYAEMIGSLNRSLRDTQEAVTRTARSPYTNGIR